MLPKLPDQSGREENPGNAQRNSKFTTSFILTGSGEGNVKNKFMFLTGTVSGAVTRSADLDDF
jgi:hypothetical protein